MRIIIAILMALTFPAAPRATVGSKPTSTQMAALSAAFNARERSGLGDAHFRTSTYWEHYFLQMRNPDAFGNFPPLGEFFFSYQLLDPENNVGLHPETEPGEPEGANIVSPPNAFHFGIEAANYPSEEIRLSGFQILPAPPGGPEDIWELGKLQRGAIDPTTGEQNAVALEASRAATYLAYSTRYPYRMGHGGFFPTPVELLSACGTAEDTGLTVSSFEIKFTALADDVIVPPHHGTLSTVDGRSVITYAGSCPFGSDYAAAGHVQYISEGPDTHVIGVFDGTGIVFDVLSVDEWVQGPYDGEGKLARYDGGHLSRAIWAFVNSFRGAPAQRTPDNFNIEKIAFSFEEFRQRQYLLAPQRGVSAGGLIEAAYPRARKSADTSIPAGTFLPFSGSQTAHEYAEGFVFAGAFAKAENLANTVAIEILSGSNVIARITLSPDAPAVIKTISNAIRPDPLRVRLVDRARFTAPGSITVEALELAEYKPNHWDAYLLLRTSATTGGFEGEGNFVDGSGIDQLAATGFYRNYLANACVVNPAAAGVRSPGNAINDCPIYDSARRLSRDMMRIVRRQELLSYEVENGKSILRFKRYAFGLKNQKADIFHCIAPSYRTAAEILEGVEYIVRSHTGGTITYNGSRLSHGRRFLGVAGVKDYTVSGDALALEYEGIRATAPKKGWSNEWLMSIETKPSHPSDTSLWKEDTYADWYLRHNRCLFYHYAIDSGLLRHITLPGGHISGQPLGPECPSAYTYALGANQSGALSTPPWTDQDLFCKSCQVYRAPYELESATVEFDAAGDDVVRLVFKTRFQSHPSAPASLARDVGTWDQSNIRVTQDYRTDDNALCEFSLLRYAGLQGTWKMGDSALLSLVQGLPDNPFGSIHPTFFFTKLMPAPYDDGNDNWNEWDTRMTIDPLLMAEIKLKAWCEGAVDGLATLEHICAAGQKPYDFTFEGLCFQAFGGRRISDFENGGHGPMANTLIRALSFNQIAAAVDLLHTFRLEGVMEFQTRAITYHDEFDVAPEYGEAHCPPINGAAATWTGSPPSPTSLFSDSGWGAGGSFSAEASAALFQCGPGGYPYLSLSVSRTEVQFRYVTKSGFESSLSPIVRELVENNYVGIFGTALRYWIFPKQRTTTVFTEAGCGGVADGAFWNGTDGLAFYQEEKTEDLGCMLLTEGVVSGGNAPGGTFFVCTESGGSQHQGTSYQSFEFTKLGDTGFALIVVPVV